MVLFSHLRQLRRVQHAPEGHLLPPLAQMMEINQVSPNISKSGQKLPSSSRRASRHLSIFPFPPSSTCSTSTSVLGEISMRRICQAALDNDRQILTRSNRVSINFLNGGLTFHVSNFHTGPHLIAYLLISLTLKPLPSVLFQDIE